MSEMLWLMTGCILLVALLYSSVGHAGASGYIAVMSLFGLAAVDIRPTALTLNILVAAIGTWQFWRAGHFSWRLYWPFALTAVPMAFIGGYLNLPTQIFEVLVGIVLLVSASQLVRRMPAEGDTRPPAVGLALGTGAGLGLLSGLTGTGGGIFLTPLLILMRWARTTTAAAVSAPFILLNSAAGLAGNLTATKSLPQFVLPLIVVVVAGGFVGSYLGSRRLPHTAIKRLLAAVLLIAGIKLILT